MIMLPSTRRHITDAIYVFVASGIFLNLGGRTVEGQPAQVIRSGPFLLQLFDSSKRFDGAKQFCESRSSWLVEVKTADVLEDLKELTRSYGRRTFWVGGSSSTSKWRWTDNTPITTDHPGYIANQCLVLKPDRTLKSNGCYSNYNFVCQSAINTTIFVSGDEFRVSRDVVTSFQDAESLCSAWDDRAHLADITSKDIDDAITNELMRRFETSSLYTGGNDIGQDGTWIWSNGVRIAGYTNWKEWGFFQGKDEPNGGTTENCLLKSPTYEGQWVDLPCVAKTKVLCQKRVFDNRCSADLCSNRGKCAATPILQGMLFKCSCNEYFIGRMCEIDPCSPNPCRNLGSCAGQRGAPYFSCSCSPEFQGQTCEDRVFRNSEGCSYHIHLQRPHIQSQAMSECRSIGSTLAILSDRKERNFILNWIKDSFARSANSREIWVGGTRTSNEWLWLDGTRMVFPGGNNPSADHECATASIGTYLTISTSVCGSRHGFVCEKPVDNSPCSTQPCQNGGTCQDVGCHYKCECAAGYDGFTCKDDLVVVTALANKITIEKNERANVTLNVASRVGSLRVLISSVSGNVEASSVSSGQHSFSVGPFRKSTRGTSVTFSLGPTSGQFSRSVTVNIVVLDRPHVSISRESAAIGFDKYITCDATGLPKPNISWYKEDEKVLESDYGQMPRQFHYRGLQVLLVTYAKTSDAGMYSCRATNVINEQDMVDEKQFYVTIPPNVVKKNATYIGEGVITISCIFESFPAPNISWTLERGLSTTTIMHDATDGIFSFTRRNLGNHRYEVVLSISLSDWLGEVWVRCTAVTRFSSASDYHKINGRMRGHEGLLYTFTNPLDKMTRGQAEVHCERIHSEICKVKDEATQKILSKSSQTLQTYSSAHIGGRAYVLNGSRVWFWSDGDMIYNETKHGSWKNRYDRNMDGTYAGWFRGRPSGVGNCMILAKNSDRYWSNVDCESGFPTICQRPMQGAPIVYSAKAGNCSSTILISWKASQKAVGIRHRIDVRPMNNGAGKYQDRIDVVATADRYKHLIGNMSFSTTYEIRIYPCPTYCVKEAGIVRYATTGADITIPVNQVNVSKMTGVQSCAISWTDNRPKKGITGYRITAVSSLVHAVSKKWLDFKERTEHDVESPDGRHFTHIGKPNRNYTFFIRTKTCAGYAMPTHADGTCIMERSAPSHVPALTQSSANIATNGTMEMNLPNLDESNGPISCVFIIVDTTPDDESIRGRTFGREELQSASILQHKSSKAIYISLALSTEAISAIDANGSVSQLSIIIGNNDTSSCDASHVSSANSRRKRSSDISNVYNGYSEPLDESNSYGVYVVTATPLDDGSIAYKSSDPVRIGRVDQYNSSSNAWIVGLAIGLLIAVVLLTGLLIMRRRRVLPVKLLDEPIELQVNHTGEEDLCDPVYQNMNEDSDCLRSDTDIPISKLQTTYKALVANAKAEFTKQYQKLAAASERIVFPWDIASDASVQKKNRYKNILPYDKNIVRLVGDKTESYINASFIEGFSQGNKFIATQGPLPATVNDFWRLVTEQQCHTVVMLTKCMEKGKKKCAKYWPDHGKKETYGQTSVYNESERKKCGYIVRSLQVTRDQKTMEVKHYQFVNWPDHGVPIATTDFFGMQRAISHRLGKLGSTVPTVIHCSAGAGRTGAFIAFNYLTEERTKLDRVDVYACVYNLRRQRVQMVQNMDQYIFIHKLLLEDYLFGNTDIDIDLLPNISRGEGFNQRISKEFFGLSVVEPLRCEVWDASSRVEDTEEDGRPYMHSRITAHRLPEEADVPYFSASSIPTSDGTVRMIAAQGPAKHSIAMFWRVVFDNDIPIVLMLTDCIEDKKEQCAQYWPNEVGSEMNLDCFNVEMTKVQSANATTICREFQLTKGRIKKNVTQYQFKDWSSKRMPSDPSFVLDLIALMKSKLRDTNNRSMLIHCSDGAGRTGTYCAIWNLLDSLSQGQTIDVFRVVKDLRDFRRGMVRTEAQYRFCYDAISDYMSTSSDYSNFDIGKGTNESVYANV